MKILHLDTEKGFRGGEGQVVELMRGLAQRGIGQALVARQNSELGHRAKEQGFEVLDLPAPAPWNPFAQRLLARWVRDGGFDLLHAHAGNAHALAVRGRAGRPIVVTRRVDFAPKGGWGSPYRAPDQHFIAISSGVEAALRTAGVPADRLHRVPSGIDPLRLSVGINCAEQRAALRAAWRIDEPGPVIGCVAAYVDHKDPLNLIEAAAAVVRELPTARVVFVGEGELRPAMEARIAALGLGGYVVLTGWRNDIGPCLSAFDLFTLPSHMEGLGTSLLDAMAVGLPCVATRAGGIVDVITDGEDGVLVPPRDSVALANALVSLWKDQARRRQMAERAVATVNERFTVEAMVEGTLAVYRRVLEGRAGGG